MNWTKTDTGYTAGAYMLNRTPGRRWVVLFRDEQVGPQYGKLSDAQAAAEQHAILELAKQQAADLADQPRDQTAQEFGQMLGVTDPPPALPPRTDFVPIEGVDYPTGGTPPGPRTPEQPVTAPDVPPTPQTPVPAPYPRDLGDEPLAQTLDRLHDIKATLPFRVGRRRLTGRPRVAA